MLKKSVSSLKNDLSASIVVFFVAIPLCLGIALASGAPLFSGLVAGIIGGIVVGSISGSKIGVSGPAAGLAAIVLTAIATLGSYENFLLAVLLAGVIQFFLGIIKAGFIAKYFPSSVVNGMLTGIGIIIILKQIPHLFGYDEDPYGDFSFEQIDGRNTFSELLNIANGIHLGPMLIGITGLVILLMWENILSKRFKICQTIQGPIVIVLVGILFFLFTKNSQILAISQTHLVNLPIFENGTSFLNQFSFPNFDVITNIQVWIVAVTLAVVGSLETLLSVEAIYQLNSSYNKAPINRELCAQGVGNFLSGMIGGLPITQVIVRSSANIQAGAKTKLATIFHGFLLLIAVILIPKILNMIPLSILAAILFVIGYKLTKPSLIKSAYRSGWGYFIPFIVTVLSIVFINLLYGLFFGLIISFALFLIKKFF